MQLNFSKKSPHIGLDIGHSRIKVILMERTPLGWKILNAVTAATPTDSMSEGVVTNPSAIAEVIKTLLRDHKITASLVDISVSSSTVVVRTVLMPKMTEEVLRKSIRFEVGRYIPNNVDDSYIEFEIVKDAPDNQMEVMIVAAPRDLVNSRIAACELAGLEVDSVDLEPFATYRSVIESDTLYGWGEKTLALVDIGARSTKVSVVSNGKFMMTRAIGVGGSTFSEALSAFFKIPMPDAEIGKSQLDLTNLLGEQTTENPPLRVLQPHLEEMLRELRRSLNYFQAQANENVSQAPVTHLVLSGGGAMMTGMAEYLAKKLDLKVMTIGILDNPRFVSASSELGSGLYLAVASGLAMRNTAPLVA